MLIFGTLGFVQDRKESGDGTFLFTSVLGKRAQLPLYVSRGMPILIQIRAIPYIPSPTRSTFRTPKRTRESPRWISWPNAYARHIEIRTLAGPSATVPTIQAITPLSSKRAHNSGASE